MLHKHITVLIDWKRKGRKITHNPGTLKKKILFPFFSIPFQSWSVYIIFTMLKPMRGIILYSTHVFSINGRAEAFSTLFQNLQLLQPRNGSAYFQLETMLWVESKEGKINGSWEEHLLLLFPIMFWCIHGEKCGNSSFILTAVKWFIVWIYHSLPMFRDESKQMGRDRSAKGNDSVCTIWIKNRLLESESFVQGCCCRVEEGNKRSIQEAIQVGSQRWMLGKKEVFCPS